MKGATGHYSHLKWLACDVFLEDVDQKKSITLRKAWKIQFHNIARIHAVPNDLIGEVIYQSSSDSTRRRYSHAVYRPDSID